LPLITTIYQDKSAYSITQKLIK